MDHELNIDLVLQSKHKSPLRAWRMTRLIFIIAAWKTIIEETTKIILQPWKLRSLLKLPFQYVYLLNKRKIDLYVENRVMICINFAKKTDIRTW